ncbi:MAG: ABC transporter permease subunit [Planctomycetota bacterium]|jgi:microcin C transport system permease protein|nr:ABC transporter permease subunit [Planctomycetota bacterium]
MAAYFARRFLLLIPTFLGITFLVFTITQFVPGGPIEQMIMKMQAAATEAGGGTQDSAVEISPEAMEALREHFNLDKPFYQAYGLWLWDLLHLDLGKSFKFNQPVSEVIFSRFPISVYFGLIGFFLAYLVCIPLGVIKAVKHGSRFDIVSSFTVFFGYSIPGWALGAVLLVLFGGGSFWDVVPLGGFRSDGWEDFTLWHKITDQLHHTILPVMAYAVASFATLTVLMKNSLMENLGQDYVRTAFAKGLSERRVILGHALRNSLIPICTGLGHAIGIVMAGSYLVEKVFNINGIGYLGYTSIVDRDYAVVMGILVINTLLILIGNILSDVLYVLVDPRIRFS